MMMTIVCLFQSFSVVSTTPTTSHSYYHHNNKAAFVTVGITQKTKYHLPTTTSRWPENTLSYDGSFTTIPTAPIGSSSSDTRLYLLPSTILGRTTDSTTTKTTRRRSESALSSTSTAAFSSWFGEEDHDQDDDTMGRKKMQKKNKKEDKKKTSKDMSSSSWILPSLIHENFMNKNKNDNDDDNYMYSYSNVKDTTTHVVMGSQMSSILVWIQDTIHGTIHSLLSSLLRSLKETLIAKTTRFVPPFFRFSLPSSSSSRSSAPPSLLTATHPPLTTNDTAAVAQGVSDLSSTMAASSTTMTTATTTSAAAAAVVESPSHHHRSAWAANHVDLSGLWKPIITNQFLQEYDEFLKNCSQPYMVRQIVKQGLHYHIEHIVQSEHGRMLHITGTNPLGHWHRTLIASDDYVVTNNGNEGKTKMKRTYFPPMNVTLVDPDGDTVHIEAWWDEDGTKHTSWLRGKPRLHGGVMETIRYVVHDSNNNNDHRKDDILICESIFHPNPSPSSGMKFQPGHVVWKYRRSVE